MNKKIIEIKNLNIKYSSKVILKNFNFTVYTWETISIIWKNWAWKSSLLKAIIWINKNFTWEIKKYYKKISYVPQKISIDKTFPITAEDFINIYNERINKEELKTFFEMFWIKNFEKRNISELSGWEFQKVLIINALISKPEIILLDEPTAWIDVIWEDIFYKNINEIKNNFPKITILIVSHNLNLVYKNSDRIICLHENNFCCHWKPCEISENKDFQKIFGDFLWKYEHSPHQKHN